MLGRKRERLQCAIAALGSAAVVACLVAIVPGGGRRAERLMPWYEVASAGDGLGPESVNMWKVPPTATFVHPNAFQDPTKWNGDHVLNGGNKEWAEEDGALHAYNMQRWRNKILGEQIDRQRSQWDLMNEADWCDCNCGARGNNGWQFKGARGTLHYSVMLRSDVKE